MKCENRFLAYVGVACGAGTLAISLLWRGPTSAPTPPPTAIPRPEPLPLLADPSALTNGPVSWTVVACRLRQDLRLDESQTAALDRALEGCDEALQKVQQLPDSLWRSRLDQRARREAYDKLTAVLKREQQEDFNTWLQVPSHTNMACWFACPTDCGCGGS
jgi:hypothetical protein